MNYYWLRQLQRRIFFIFQVSQCSPFLHRPGPLLTILVQILSGLCHSPHYYRNFHYRNRRWAPENMILITVCADLSNSRWYASEGRWNHLRSFHQTLLLISTFTCLFLWEISNQNFKFQIFYYHINQLFLWP